MKMNLGWRQYDISVLARGRQAHIRQKRLIRLLRADISRLEKGRRILGFAFNHYFNHDEHLALRFDSQDENVDSDLRGLLNRLQKQLDFSPEVGRPHDWTSPNRIGGSAEPVLRAYELGSRLAFSAFDLQPDRWCADSNANVNGPYAASAYNRLILHELRVETSRQREVYQQLIHYIESKIGRQRPDRTNLAEEDDPLVIQLTDEWYVCISDLTQRERIRPDWFADIVFLSHLCHGAMNSLGFSYQDEARMYRALLPNFG